MDCSNNWMWNGGSLQGIAGSLIDREELGICLGMDIYHLGVE